MWIKGVQVLWKIIHLDNSMYKVYTSSIMERNIGLKHAPEALHDIARFAVRHLTTQPLASHGEHTFPKNHQDPLSGLHELFAQQVAPPKPLQYDKHGYPVWTE